MAKIEELLPELAEFSPQRIRELLGKLGEEIQIGLDRILQGRPPTQADGGLLAIPYPLGWPNRGKLLTCPAQRVLTSVFAGQNWRAEVWGWDGSEWHREEETQVKKVMEEKERLFKGKEAFGRYLGLMVDVVQAALEKAKNPGEISSLAVSYGFPQKNEKVNYGIEASLMTDSLSKYWSVEKAAGRHLGKPLLAELKKRGYTITKIYFANDSLAVALDTLAGKETLPVGVVIGNGANMAMESGGVLVNLESGQSRSLGTDSILVKMWALGLIPETQAFPFLEYYLAGAYQLPRLVAALYLLVKEGILDRQIAERFLQAMRERGNDARILDRLITDEMDQKSLNEYLSVKDAPFALIKQTTQLVLKKAVEVAALMMTSVLQVGGWRQGQIPAVGSVFWKARVTPEGKIFGGETIRLVNQWTGGDFEAIPANELRGVASLALV